MTDIRLKAKIWVSAYLRRCGVESIPAVVVRRGDSDAGAVYVKLNLLDGSVRVFAPAPPGLSPPGDRQWTMCMGNNPVAERDADAYLSRQSEFDPDLWILEVEDRQGRHGLDLVPIG